MNPGKWGNPTNSFTDEKRIGDYDDFRGMIERFADDLFTNSPEPTAVVNRLVKLVDEKNPTFNHPTGKASSLLLTIQFFAFKIFEKLLNKDLNKFKISK